MSTSTRAGQRPGLVDLGVGFVVAAAAVNLVIAIVLVQQVAVAGARVNPGLLAVVVGITVLYAAGLVVLGMLLRSGRVWARAALLSLTSLSLLTLFALNALNLVVTILLVVADVLLYRPSVSAWVRASRGLSVR